MTSKSKRERKAKIKQAASLATMIRRFKDGFEAYTGADNEASEQKIWRKTVEAPAVDLDKRRPPAKNLEDVLVAIDFVLQSEQFEQSRRVPIPPHRMAVVGGRSGIPGQHHARTVWTQWTVAP
jgi:hypothetical protein